MVLKPAEQTPLTALRLGEIAARSGNSGRRRQRRHRHGSRRRQLDRRAHGYRQGRFTGSTEVGKLILQASAGNLKRVSLELGGKSPNIVLPDADMDAAVRTAVNGVFFNSGQVCVAGTRIFVQRDQYDGFVDKLTKASAAMTTGDPLDPDTRLGPLVSKEQFDRVNNYMEIGKKEGARVTIGGESVGGKGYFVKPTVFADVTTT